MNEYIFAGGFHFCKEVRGRHRLMQKVPERGLGCWLELVGESVSRKMRHWCRQGLTSLHCHPGSPFLMPGTVCSHEGIPQVSVFFRTTFLVRRAARDYAGSPTAAERMPGQGTVLTWNGRMAEQSVSAPEMQVVFKDNVSPFCSNGHIINLCFP